ncbi:calpain-8-like isoform X2 [Phyllobates terribilis]|uniref:calpain-8-like isoform X2 n=1 Tax=Phyllobates terribilis TaxID=111132 RepID=UPI003CCB1A27
MSGVASKIAQDRAKAAGLGSPKNPIKFASQDFEKLKAECLASKTLFEDPQFPAAQSSLGTKQLGPDSQKAKGLEWKRPKELKTNPVFIIGGAEREDVNQGGLGDCWFLGSIACLTTNKNCLFRVIPQDQSFEKDYAGIFRFKFWQYGQWVEVVVDDRLPTKNNKLIFVKSKTSEEFWSALLEKAYAKINGSYEGLVAGHVLESLQDFTGGVGELYRTKSAPNDLFEKIQRRLLEKSLVGCTSFGDSNAKSLSESIVRGHIYSITREEEVTSGENKVQLIRVWNPWGYSEWTGAWSDNSDEWNNVDPKTREELNIKKDEGEFWMAFHDFLKEYHRVEICNINLSEVCCGDDFKWCLTEFNGSWKNGSTAGGNKDLDTFCINPQYRITLEAPDGDTSKKCPIIVSLTQKDRRKIKYECAAFLYLGIYIFKLNPSDKIPLVKEFFKDNDYVAFSEFDFMRDISKKFELLPGDYVIVSATYNASDEADFYLRIFTEKPTKAKEADGDMQANIWQPVLTPETDSEFDIVKDELQKGEFNENKVKDMLDKMLAKYPELQSVGFARKTIRDLIKLMDVDNTMTLSTNEFKKTWLKVENYWNIFKCSDSDKSGTLCAADLRTALIKAGFNCNITFLNAVVDKLAHDNLNMDFNTFVSTAANLETLLNMFNILKPDEGGLVSLSLDEWLLTKLA